MLDIVTYEEKIAKDAELKKLIRELLVYVIAERKFKFKLEEITFDFDILLNNKILIQSDSYLEISNSALFHSEFFTHYSTLHSFQLTENINDAFQFIKTIKAKLQTDKPLNNGIHSFFRNFKSFILFQIHRQFGSDFNQYITALGKESGQILYDFNSAYCVIVPYLSTPVEVLFENLKHLMETIKSDAMFDGNAGAIGNAIRKYSISNLEAGKKLLQYSLENQNPVIHNLNIPMIGGIYEKERELFWNEIVHLYAIEENYVSIICALASTPALSNEEASKQYELISSIQKPTPDALLNLTKFYVAVINNKTVTDSNLKEACFKQIGEIIINPLQNIRAFTLWEIQFIEGYEIKIVELVKKIISTEDFDKSQLKNVGDVFITHKHLPSFIDFLKDHADRFKISFKAELFSSVLYHFHQNDSENFSIEIIQLLTHDKGELRYVGNRIIEHLRPLNGKFKFSVDILQFDALTQYKLWVSVLGEIKQPKESLPMLMPLLDSTYRIVQEAFICKMELLTKEYSTAVLNVLEDEIDLNNIKFSEIFERIKLYKDCFFSEIDKKHGIRELDPLYTQPRLLRFYNENYGKSLNKTVSDGVEKRSLFSQIGVKTVVLAKGGGWKHENKKEISKLGTVGVSFQLPRSCFINPELFDWEFRTRYFENWENEFKEWETIISS